MSLTKNIGIGKMAFSFFRYIDYSNVMYFTYDDFNSLKNTYEKLDLLPNRKEVMAHVSELLEYPSSNYEIWLEGRADKVINFHLRYYSLNGEVYDSFLFQLDSGNNLFSDIAYPYIVYHNGLQSWAERLVNMNVGYKFSTHHKYTIIYGSY